MKTLDIINQIKRQNPRGVWANAVRDDALRLLRGIELDETDLSNGRNLEKALLSGAENWNQYSWGGCALCYNKDIALHYCTPSELKKTDYGNRRPNNKEQWLDVQARALYQACELIKQVFYQIKGALK